MLWVPKVLLNRLPSLQKILGLLRTDFILEFYTVNS